MDILVSLFIIGFVLNSFSQREQRLRIQLLGSYLVKYQIERLMENLMQGYSHALDESNPQRQQNAWVALESTEAELCRQLEAFAQSFSQLPRLRTRTSKLPFNLPYATKWLPDYTFNTRRAFSLHAHAISQAAVLRHGQNHKDKAFTMMAEMLLLRHTCHWFCRSKMVASMRLMAQHKSPYQQVLTSVAPSTREAYLTLVGQ